MTMPERTALEITQTAGWSTAAWGMVTFEHVVAAIGVAIAIISLLTQFWFSWRKDKREREMHSVRMELIRSGNGDDTHADRPQRT